MSAASQRYLGVSEAEIALVRVRTLLISALDQTLFSFDN